MYHFQMSDDNQQILEDHLKQKGQSFWYKSSPSANQNAHLQEHPYLVNNHSPCNNEMMSSSNQSKNFDARQHNSYLDSSVTTTTHNLRSSVEKINDEGAITCNRCQKIPIDYIFLNCSHNFCLECMAISVLKGEGRVTQSQYTDQDTQTSCEGAGFNQDSIDTIAMRCYTCGQDSELGQQSTRAIDILIQMVLQKYEQKQTTQSHLSNHTQPNYHSPVITQSSQPLHHYILQPSEVQISTPEHTQPSYNTRNRVVSQNCDTYLNECTSHPQVYSPHDDKIPTVTNYQTTQQQTLDNMGSSGYQSASQQNSTNNPNYSMLTDTKQGNLYSPAQNVSSIAKKNTHLSKSTHIISPHSNLFQPVLYSLDSNQISPPQNTPYPQQTQLTTQPHFSQTDTKQQQEKTSQLNEDTHYSHHPQTKRLNISYVEEARTVQHEDVHDIHEQRYTDQQDTHCQDHPFNDLSLFCFTCDYKLLCIRCLQSGEHKNHDVQNVHKNFDYLVDKMCETSHEINASIELLSVHEKQLQETCKECVKQIKTIKHQIEINVSDVKTALEFKEKELLQQAENLYTTKSKQIQAHIHNIHNQTQALQDVQKQFEFISQKNISHNIHTNVRQSQINIHKDLHNDNDYIDESTESSQQFSDVEKLNLFRFYAECKSLLYKLGIMQNPLHSSYTATPALNNHTWFNQSEQQQQQDFSEDSQNLMSSQNLSNLIDNVQRLKTEMNQINLKNNIFKPTINQIPMRNTWSKEAVYSPPSPPPLPLQRNNQLFHDFLSQRSFQINDNTQQKQAEKRQHEEHVTRNRSNDKIKQGNCQQKHHFNKHLDNIFKKETNKFTEIGKYMQNTSLEVSKHSNLFSNQQNYKQGYVGYETERQKNTNTLMMTSFKSSKSTLNLNKTSKHPPILLSSSPSLKQLKTSPNNIKTNHTVQTSRQYTQNIAPRISRNASIHHTHNHHDISSFFKIQPSIRIPTTQSRHHQDIFKPQPAIPSSMYSSKDRSINVDQLFHNLRAQKEQFNITKKKLFFHNN